MNSTRSFFSISPPIVLENLRRFWTIPAFGFAAYFLTGLFPLILDVDNRDYMFRAILEFRHPGFIAFFCLFPLITAAVLQRYMFAPGSVAVMHSLPFTRARLFNSQLVSGLLLIWLPIVAVCLISVAMSFGSPWHYKELLDSGAMEAQVIPVYVIAARFALMLLLTFFVFAVCLLAGIVCGNTPMHLVVCILLNSILPMIVSICYAYCTHFLFGFDASSESLEFIGSLSPLSYLPITAGAPGALAIVVYIAAGALICVCASILYARRPLEKAGDSITFRFMEWVICFATTLAGTTLMAFYFQTISDNNNNMYFYAGMAIGAVITMLITRIILKKSPRIWNRETAVQFGVFAAVVLVLLLSLRLDLFGYERRIPAGERIASATLNIPTPGYPGEIVQPYTYSGAGFYTFSEPENIAAITAFHRNITDRRHEPRNIWPYYEAYSRLNLQYSQPGIFGGVSRSWRLPLGFFAQDENLRRLVESDEFRAQNSLDNPKLGTLRQISIRGYADSEQIALSSYEFDGFKAAVNADLRLLPAERIFSTRVPFCMLYLEFQQQAEGRANIPNGQISIGITADFKNTVEWLADSGYYELITGWIGAIDSIQLVHVVDDVQESVGFFSDPYLIRMAVDYGENMLVDGREYYIVAPTASSGLPDGWHGITDDLPMPAPAVMPDWYLSPGNPALKALLAATGE
ncbi:MAG: hypothetical protein LBH39_05165 [Clostridiales Family XIII bacterium]|jgi:hypothetical protein|nr:hypothetical protein [Clostridiales Family XIII bacterium]